MGRAVAAVSRPRLESWVEFLTASQLAGRRAGGAGSHAVASALAEQMAELGLTPPATWGGHCQSFQFLEDQDANVVGHLEPSGADDRWILIGAHYDGQGIHPAGTIYPGADDNASGVAALLEVARLASLRRRNRSQTLPQHGWVFVALGSEEVGQLGARAYLATPSVELSRIEGVINLDMVGRALSPESREAIGYRVLSGSRQKMVGALRRSANRAGLEIRPLADLGPRMPMITDAEIFAPRVPTVLLSTGLHADHHKITDVPTRIDYGQIERSVSLVLALADILAGRS